ncbi:MAG: hypothetical protein HYZ53_22155 [Planctomycetes bacterium]|nr:hypothetical protein [Planctomycetota bacterium]
MSRWVRCLAACLGSLGIVACLGSVAPAAPTTGGEAGVAAAMPLLGPPPLQKQAVLHGLAPAKGTRRTAGISRSGHEKPGRPAAGAGPHRPKPIVKRPAHSKKHPAPKPNLRPKVTPKHDRGGAQPSAHGKKSKKGAHASTRPKGKGPGGLSSGNSGRLRRAPSVKASKATKAAAAKKGMKSAKSTKSTKGRGLGSKPGRGRSKNVRKSTAGHGGVRPGASVELGNPGGGGGTGRGAEIRSATLGHEAEPLDMDGR